MCETINSTSEVEATDNISQESESTAVQWKAMNSWHSQPYCRDQYNRTIPTCGLQLSNKALWQTESRIVANRITHFKVILSCVLFACNNMQNQIFKAARSKELGFISKGFSNWKKVLARLKKHQVSECHKIANDYDTDLSRTCWNVWKMSSDAAKKRNGV